MKAQERHQLKQNDLLQTATSVTDMVSTHRSQVALVIGGVLVIGALAGGWFYYRSQQNNAAGALLGVAMATAQAPISPAPSLPGAKQIPGTYPTEKDRAEAAIKAFSDVAAQFPGTESAQAALYQAGSELLSLGRAAEAQQAFQKVAASGSAFYAPLARLGEAEALMATGKSDDAIKIYTELSANRESTLPVDGLLMELARAAQKAGKTQDARAAFKRVVDEFPNSGYAADARQSLAALN